MNRLFLIPFAVLLWFNTSAYWLTGIVTDGYQKPLPFANVYIMGTSKGTTTNEDGHYQLELETGKYEIIFDFIGYSRIIKQMSIHDDLELKITLLPEEVKLNEVVINASEDPAYPIMREAIKKRKYYYEQVESYTTRVYTKGLQRIISAPDKIFGQSINFDGSLDSNNSGIVYLSESISELSFKQPDKVQERMISSKVSGNSQSFSWNRAGDFYIFNFYQNNIPIEFVSDRVFISPLSENAMMFYRYKLDGFYEEDGRLINKIKVTPRRPNDPVFTGYIYIVEDSWNIHSLDLFLTKNNQLKYIDTLNIKQVYIPLSDSLWMQMSQRFDFIFKILSISAKGYFGIIYQDYDVNVALSKKNFTNELLSVEDNANKKDTTYWKTYRPVPLTSEEISDYARKDSLEELRQSKEYLRVLDKTANKFNPWDILIGYHYQNSYRKLYVSFIPPIQGFNYNTVEGFNFQLKTDITKEFAEKNRTLRFDPVVRYGFSNQHFNAKIKSQFNYNSKNFSYIELEFGKYVFQFNNQEPISELINSFYSLFIGKNYMKIYENAFIKIKHRVEITNGLMLWSSVQYSKRYSLENTSSVTTRSDENTDFTENRSFENHDAFIFAAELRFRPGQKYLSRPDGKIIIGSKFPDFRVFYKKSIPGILNSSQNFDYVQFSISDNLQFGLLGNGYYKLKVGTFINDNKVELMDQQHFLANQTVFGRHYTDGFQLLNYYEASTTNSFIEAHYQHNFDGFLFNKIPGIRKLKFQAVFGVHFLYSEDFKDYTEISVGIENIIRVFRIDFVTGLKNNQSSTFGFRLGLDFNQL